MVKIPYKVRLIIWISVLAAAGVFAFQIFGGDAGAALKKPLYLVLVLFGIILVLLKSNYSKQRLIFYLEGSLDSLPFPVTTTDINMKWVFINKVTETLLAQHNLDKKSVLGKHCSSWKADICETENCGITCLRNGQEITNYNQEYPDAPSTYMQVETHYILDDTGKQIGHVEVVSNVDVNKQMSETAKVLLPSSEKLLEVSSQLAQSSEETSGRSDSVAAASEEMSSNMETMAKGMEDTALNMTHVASAVEEMNATISEIAKSSENARSITNRAVEQGVDASDQVNELGESAKKIETITETISDISEQTNLLALNATIEAARAGEAGKGFAVVAAEIKELAKQTSDATDDIKQSVERIQSSTSGTVAQIENISSVINDINDIVSGIASAVEEQSVTCQEMSKNVANASDLVTEVNNNISQNTTVSAEIAKDIAVVNESSMSTAQGSSQLSLKAQELSDLAKKLSSMVSDI